jgi:hypothetical protein
LNWDKTNVDTLMALKYSGRLKFSRGKSIAWFGRSAAILRHFPVG